MQIEKLIFHIRDLKPNKESLMYLTQSEKYNHKEGYNEALADVEYLLRESAKEQ